MKKITVDRRRLVAIALRNKIEGVSTMSCDELAKVLIDNGVRIDHIKYCEEHLALGKGVACKLLLHAKAVTTSTKETKMGTRTKEEANRMLEELMLQNSLDELATVTVVHGEKAKDMIPTSVSEIKELVFNARRKTKGEDKVMVETTAVVKEKIMPLVAKASKVVLDDGTDNVNPGFMQAVKFTGIYKHLVWDKSWITVDGKRKMVKTFAGLKDYEDVVAPLPVHSPLKQFIDAGELRYCRIAQLDQLGKFYKREKASAFRCFAQQAAGAGYLCIQPDWKDSELQIFYETPEKLAAFFNISLEKLYKSLGKLHKWLKLVKTPTKLTIQEDTEIRVLYINEENNQYGKPRYDGDIVIKYDLMAFKAGGARLWEGFSSMMQMRSYKSTGLLLKGLAIFNEAHFNRRARVLQEKYNYSPKRFDMIINQHSVKFDGIGLEDGKIYTFKASELFRFVGLRARAGSSRYGAQLVAMSDMNIASGILKEHGLMESALLIKALAKGMPYAWIHIAHDYRKVDTNKFLELAFCINRPQYGWRMAKMATLHNRNMSFLESEWRKRISSVQVNFESAYAYTDERCDDAIKAWFDKTGEYKSFAVLPVGTTEDELNDKGEIASIKYPLHSAPCVCSHTALREDIFNPESKLIGGLYGGLGLPTLYQRSVMGLDTDGDKLAKFKTAFSVIPEFDLTQALVEEKVEVAPITTLAQAVEETITLAHGAAADTLAIGTIDLTIRYCFMWSHLNGVAITPQISAAVGALREGGIKGGVKGDTKGIAASSTQLDIPASLEAGTLSQDILTWFSALVGRQVDPMSDFGEVNKENLAEIAHYLAVKGAGCKERGHGDKFLHRMQTLLPAYMAHAGDKSNNPWHDAMVLLSEGIKPEYLTAEKMDCRIIQNQYTATWKLIQASFRTYGKEGLDYEFDLEQVMNFANWINQYYKRNSRGIQSAFRGEKDRETGEMLVAGDFDAERKTRRFIKLLRVIRFLLNGLVPHPADIEQLPSGAIPEGIASRCLTFGDKNRQTMAYLKFAHIYIGTTEFNVAGTEGNSGGMAWNFPASVVYEARAMYYDSTTEGKKEVRNPFLGMAEELAVEFDNMWLKRAQDWVAKNPYANEFIYPEMDEDGFEEDETAKDVHMSSDDFDSCD